MNPFLSSKKRIFVGLFCMICMLLIAPPLFSQDVIPTDAPLVTETPSATATFTETALSTATETATATHTATPLPTATETLTATYTETVVETPSVTLAQASETASVTASPPSAANETPAVSINTIPTPTPSVTATYSGEGGPVPVAMPVMAARAVDVTAATVTELINQINAANANCSRPTVITLTTSNYNLTAVNDATFYGNNGLPIIRCDITIKGVSGISTIQRNYGGTTPLFRIFGVDSSGILRLNRIQVRNGSASDIGGSGILIIQGQAYVTSSQVVGNALSLTTSNQIIGAGIYNYLGTLQVQNSSVSNNSNTSTTADGGGIGVIGGSTTLSGATVNGNRANRQGGGIAVISSGASVVITTSTLQSNIAGSGGGIYISSGLPYSITRTLLQSNTLLSGTLGAALYSGSNGGNPVIYNSCFISNGDFAVAGISGASVNARNNWWGSTSGPVVDVASVDPRDSVTFTVLYQPFVTTAPANPAVNCLNGVIPPTPTPTATATPTVSQQLLAYGVTTAGNWSAADLQALLNGVTKTGQALQSQFGGAAPQHAFKRVMFRGNPSPTSEIRFVRSTDPGAYCQTNNNVAAPLQAEITCYVSVQFSEYTAVHELGHVYVGRTGGYNSGSTYFGLIDQPPLRITTTPGTTVPDPVLRDSNGFVVMGNRIDPSANQPDWVRGQRGWGSAAATPPAVPCNYQQNPFTVNDWQVTATPGNTQRTAERDEAAADMFLNWVYSKINAGGFANNTYAGINNCAVTPPADSSNPGTARNNFMNIVVLPTLATYVPTPTP